MLNALPFALLLRPATPGLKVDQLFKGVQKQLSVMSESRKERLSALTELKKQSMVIANNKANRNEMHRLIVQHMCNCPHYSDEDYKDFSPQIHNYTTKAMIDT